MAGPFVGGALGGAATAMVAVAKRLAVVAEKRIISTMRYNRIEEEGGRFDLQKVKRVLCQDAEESKFSTRLDS